MGAAVRQLASLDKALYFFAIDGGKVAHTNILPKGQVKSSFDAKSWLSSVSSVVGGRVCPRLYSLFSVSDAWARFRVAAHQQAQLVTAMIQAK